jgi:hypothetical protein
LIGGNVDLDLLSLFPQIDSTSMGGIESRESFFKVNNGGERGWEEATSQRGNKGTFYSPLQNMTIAAPSGSTARLKSYMKTRQKKT